MLGLAAVAAVLALGAHADDPARGAKEKDPARVGQAGEAKDQTRATAGATDQPRELSGTVVKAEARRSTWSTWARSSR